MRCQRKDRSVPQKPPGVQLQTGEEAMPFHALILPRDAADSMLLFQTTIGITGLSSLAPTQTTSDRLKLTRWTTAEDLGAGFG